MDKKVVLNIVNQVFEIEKKLIEMDSNEKFRRNISRIYYEFEEGLNVLVKNPIGESYNDGRLDCDANIVGDLRAEMKITDTIKPIVYQKNPDGSVVIVQKAVVIVSAK